MSPRPKRRQSHHSRSSIIRDVWGDGWTVRERRPTPYGFAIMLGRPYPPQGRCGGMWGQVVIVTPRFAAWVRANAQRPHIHPIPISLNSYRRIRRALGVDRQAWTEKRLAWWIDRVGDLGTLTAAEFVAKHGDKPWTRTGKLTNANVLLMRQELLGRKLRPAGWWKVPSVQTLLRSTVPAPVVAARLKLSLPTVYGLRRQALGKSAR
ncbi:MAG TPA: hypothetical protein VNU46_03690 [Gemmatimonadaceae bacterium]|jgi:hypothetical protein|nr:hypothetical protein [Gemmatimonadaceae bacterium]